MDEMHKEGQGFSACHPCLQFETSSRNFSEVWFGRGESRMKSPFDFEYYCQLIVLTIQQSNMRRNERIPLADLIHAYLPTPNSQPKQLTQALADLQTLVAYTHSPFPKLANDMRKKIVEREKVFRVAQVAAQASYDFLYDQPRANGQLASNIIKLSSPPLIIKKQKPILKTELKLFFLESKGVSVHEWSAFYRPELGVLAVSVPGENAEVLVGMGEQEGSGLEWKVFGATIEGQLSLQLSQFLQIFFKWSRQNKPGWKQFLLADIKAILRNLQTILLYLEFTNQFPSQQNMNISDKGIFTVKQNVNSSQFEWSFSFFHEKQAPNFILSIREQQMLQILFLERQMKAKLFISSQQEDVQPLKLEVFGCKIPNFDELVDLPRILLSLQQSFNKVYATYPSLKYQKISFFGRILGSFWLPQRMAEYNCKEADQEGLWIMIQIQKKCLLQVGKDGQLSSKIWDSKILDEVLLNGMSIDNLGRHLGLYQQVIEDNEALQFTIHQVRMERGISNKNHDQQRLQNWTVAGRQPYVVYQFRSERFHTNQRHLPTLKPEQKQKEKYNDFQNCVLLVEIPFDFTVAKFSGWKFNKGSSSVEEKKNFLPDWWKNHLEEVDKGGPLNWQLLGNAIGYYCRCYLVERVKDIFNQQDKRANFIDLK